MCLQSFPQRHLIKRRDATDRAKVKRERKGGRRDGKKRRILSRFRRGQTRMLVALKVCYFISFFYFHQGCLLLTKTETQVSFLTFNAVVRCVMVVFQSWCLNCGQKNPKIKPRPLALNIDPVKLGLYVCVRSMAYQRCSVTTCRVLRRRQLSSHCLRHVTSSALRAPVVCFRRNYDRF